MEFDGFDWDEGNWPKCGKHGVSRAEIEAVFAAEPFVGPDQTVSEEVRLNAIAAIGGRHVFVAFTIRQIGGETRIRPISARYMHDKEVRRYEQFKRGQTGEG